MRLARHFAAVLAAIAGAAGSAAIVVGCSGGAETGTGGAGGAPVQTSNGGNPPVCPTYEDYDAGADGPVLIVTPAADDEALCTALGARSMQCDPACPPEPQEHCALGWACVRKSLRPDMIDDLYACFPTVPCGMEDQTIGLCAAQLRDKYPPTASQLAYEKARAKFDEVCGGDPSASSCADGSCGGRTDAYYDALTSCIDQGGECLSVAICTAIVASLEVEAPCLGPAEGDGGTSDGG